MTHTLDPTRKTIDISITNYCNARCPTCKRFVGNSYDELQVNPGLKVEHADISTFKNIITANHSYFVGKDIIFCGEFGDPLMHPKVADFARIAHDATGGAPKEGTVKIYTNGGLRRPELLELLKEDNTIGIVFGIDGLTQEINEKYRAGVNLERAMENMLQTAEKNYNLDFRMQPVVSWDFTVFKHNIHHVEDAIKLALQYNIPFSIRPNSRNNKSFTGLESISDDDFVYLKDIAMQYKDGLMSKLQPEIFKYLVNKVKNEKINVTGANWHLHLQEYNGLGGAMVCLV